MGAAEVRELALALCSPTAKGGATLTCLPAQTAELGLSMVAPPHGGCTLFPGLAQVPSPLPRSVSSLVSLALLCLLPPL